MGMTKRKVLSAVAFLAAALRALADEAGVRFR